MDELHSLATELHSLSSANASITWQQLRLLWLREGDANSKYFHAIMLGRRRRNSISSIIVENNHVEGVMNVREAVFTHFINDFQTQDIIRPRVDNLQFRRLSIVESVHLTYPFIEEELKAAVWDCDSFKSPGPDGVHLGFIKDFWPDLKSDIMRFVLEWSSI